MLGLEQAIKHCKEKAIELREQASTYEGVPCTSVNREYAVSCLECAKEHEQLAEWLTELKAYREAFGSLDVPGISFGKRLAEALTKIEEIRNNERE